MPRKTKIQVVFDTHDCLYCQEECTCGAKVPWDCKGHGYCQEEYKEIRNDYDDMNDNGDL